MVSLLLPVPVRPGVIAEDRRILQLLFGDPGDITVELRVIFQGTPGDGVVAMAEPQESTEAHDRVGDTAGELIDHQMVDFTDLLTVRFIDVGAFDIFARDKLMVGMDGAGCHGCTFRC